MKILGIDPGTATTGYGIIEKVSNDKIYVITYGIIQTQANLSPDYRLQIIYHDILNLIEEFKPDIMSIEQLFFFKNQKTIITVSQARGVVLLAARECNIQIAEYTPLQVKQALTGYGKATKQEVQEMLKIMLDLDSIPKPDDAADAIAVAICHVNTCF